jgi:hypothetical protein
MQQAEEEEDQPILQADNRQGIQRNSLHRNKCKGLNRSVTNNSGTIYGARPTDAAGRMIVNRFKFYERVIKLGSNSRKYHKEATGSRKVPTEVTGNKNS